MLQAEDHHRGHAQAEQVFADWTDGPLAHLPSGSFPANAAWLALAAISHNLLRAAGSLASLACAKARGATLRRDLIDVAARTARHGRGHLTLHLPEGWHREHERASLFQAATGPPPAAARPAQSRVTALPSPTPATSRPPASTPGRTRGQAAEQQAARQPHPPPASRSASRASSRETITQIHAVDRGSEFASTGVVYGS
jgi:hypothetical protein